MHHKQMLMLNKYSHAAHLDTTLGIVSCDAVIQVLCNL